MVITNQGVAIQPCFHVSKTYAIYKTGHWVVFIKTRTETCIKGWIELAVFKAFGEVLSFGLGVAERVLIHLLTALLVNGFSFAHSVVYNAHKQAHNQNTENKDLSSSSKRGHIKYRAWSDIFGCASNGMVKTILRERGKVSGRSEVVRRIK